MKQKSLIIALVAVLPFYALTLVAVANNTIQAKDTDLAACDSTLTSYHNPFISAYGKPAYDRCEDLSQLIMWHQAAASTEAMIYDAGHNPRPKTNKADDQLKAVVVQ